MKKTFVLIVLLIFSFSFANDLSNDLFIFKNIGILSLEYPWTDELNLNLKSDENIIFVENADYYTVNLGSLENIKYKIVGNYEDLKETLSNYIVTISSNPLILRDSLNPTYIYFYNNFLGLWCKTESDYLKEILNNKVFYAKNIKGLVQISKPISWDLFYNLKENGDLFVTYNINGVLDEKYNVYLIDEIINEIHVQERTLKSMSINADYIPEIINESAVIKFGEITPFNGVYSKVIKLGTIKKYEDINYLNINFYSSSFENRYLSIIREFENTKDNGLGIPIINGKLYLFTKKDNKEFINKVSNLPKTNINSKVEINLGQSWNSTADLNILRDNRTNEFVDRTFDININSSEKTKIVISGQAMKLLSIKGNYLSKIENSDKITIYVQGKQKLEVNIRSTIK
ncbi:hypothetical protein [Marinitoga sp. 38H-ov]|uniref:hypothetical protein n=1 Tax=Marinitoga sp. 38H-ov TaxID=1755814 RepID=UPI0013E9ECCF|nr:hypothetical protein [Marinitoga sp. 38H-ov]KAF2956769.1 hypothetical protein AS160_04180 [Marinitoga sp. 38H-ov]